MDESKNIEERLKQAEIKYIHNLMTSFKDYYKKEYEDLLKISNYACCSKCYHVHHNPARCKEHYKEITDYLNQKD